MKRHFLSMTFAALSGVTNVSMAAVDSVPLTTVTHLGQATTTFSCGHSSSGVCNYMVLVSLCKETLLANGIKEKRCSYLQVVPAFRLKAGGTKTITNLPADYLYTMNLDRMPTVGECVDAPMPH
jgi:hypothetical protein